MSLETAKRGSLTYEYDPAISAPHGFTTRLGGVSAGHLQSLNIGLHRGDEMEALQENYRRLSQALGFDPEALVLTRQTHSDIVRVVTEADAGRGFDHTAWPECDALVTNRPGVALAVFTADCTPILLFDPETGAVGAVHAGWKGTAQDIAGKTVQKMQEAFGCQPQNLRCAIGANIGPCCFETDADVPQALVKTYGAGILPYISQRGGKFFPDLKKINAVALERAGVRHISQSTHCTVCRPDLYWSHRVTKGIRGSQGAIIVCKEGR